MMQVQFVEIEIETDMSDARRAFNDRRRLQPGRPSIRRCSANWPDAALGRPGG